MNFKKWRLLIVLTAFAFFVSGCSNNNNSSVSTDESEEIEEEYLEDDEEDDYDEEIDSLGYDDWEAGDIIIDTTEVETTDFK